MILEESNCPRCPESEVSREWQGFVEILNPEKSSLAKNCDVFLNTRVEKESCPLNLAPTTSTTVTMAIGDACQGLAKSRSEGGHRWIVG